MNQKYYLLKIAILLMILSRLCFAREILTTTMTDSDRVTIENEISSVIVSIMKAAEHADVDKMFAPVLDSEESVFIRNGQLLHSRQETLDFYKKAFQGLQKVEYRMDRQLITVLSPQIVLVTWEGQSTAIINDGRTFTSRFAQTIVFVKENDWKILHIHTSAPAA